MRFHCFRIIEITVHLNLQTNAMIHVREIFVPPNYGGFDGERLLYCGIETDTRDNIESNQFNIYKNGFHRSDASQCFL